MRVGEHMIFGHGFSRAIQLSGKRVYLRAPRNGDFAHWQRCRDRSREHLQPWEPLWHPDAMTKRGWRICHQAWKAGWREGRTFAFFIWHRETNALLGGVAISNVRRGAAQTGSLGYWLDIEAVEKGYMFEAVEAVIEFAQKTLGLMRLEASTLPENERSQRLLVKCGFVKEGQAEAFLQIAGDRRTHVLYGLNVLAKYSDKAIRLQESR